MPQPWLGRCWNRPRESRSPKREVAQLGLLDRRRDGDRRGARRQAPAHGDAAIVAALPVCSGSKSRCGPAPSTCAGRRRRSWCTDARDAESSRRPRRRRAATASEGTAAAAAGAGRRPVGRARGRRAASSGVGVQRGVELDAAAVRGRGLDRAGHASCGGTAVARRPDSSAALTTGPSAQRHLGAGRDVEPGLDDAVVAERDADAGVGAEQAALADARRAPCRRRTACP